MGDGGPRFRKSADSIRTGPRRKARVEACLFDEFGEPVVMETLDLGPAGMFVRSDLIYDPGQELFVSLNLEGGPTFVIRGRVVRAELGGRGLPAGMGIAFVDLTRREARWLRWYADRCSGMESPAPVLAGLAEAEFPASRHILP